MVSSGKMGGFDARPGRIFVAVSAVLVPGERFAWTYRARPRPRLPFPRVHLCGPGILKPSVSPEKIDRAVGEIMALDKVSDVAELMTLVTVQRCAV